MSIFRHLDFSNQDVFKIVSEESKDIKHSIIEGPGLKVFQFPEHDFEVVFEQHRLIVNDKAGGPYKESKISEILVDLMKMSKAEPKSYGYNFDFKVSVDDSFSTSNLLGEKLVSFDNISDIGATLSFDKDELKVGLNIKPIKESDKEFWVHINIHHEETLPDSVDDIKANLISSYKIAEEVILSI